MVILVIYLLFPARDFDLIDVSLRCKNQVVGDLP